VQDLNRASDSRRRFCIFFNEFAGILGMLAQSRFNNASLAIIDSPAAGPEDIGVMRFRTMVRRILPRFAVEAYFGYRESKLIDLNRRMSTEEVFTDVYSKNRWGGAPGSFFSGAGSHEATIVGPYVAGVKRELERIGAASMTVIDLGCGDFSVGRQIAPQCGRYVGVDIVKPLIDHNRKIFGNSGVSFVHANMVTDDLPDGDVCLVRQVFQHLSNDQILAVLPKLDRYRYSIVTEHQPSDAHLRRSNADKPHGGGIRARQQSGVFLDQPPFDFPSARYRLLLQVPGPPIPGRIDPGVIRTFVLAGAGHPAPYQPAGGLPVNTAN
jgi:methyltransferase family protein